MTSLDDTTFRIEFHRCLDGIVYTYEPAGLRNHRPCWRRVDLALHLHWTDRSGWIISDEAGVVLSRPWDFERDEQGPLPPEGIWVSRKNAKSYVYEHRHVRAP
jgi:hypothetical protein